MAKELSTEILINARPEIVWNVLTNFQDYPEWNPFIKSLTGNVAEGNSITVRLEPPGAKGMTFNPKVLAYTMHQEFRWLGHLMIPGIFDGEHRFELIRTEDGQTRFRHSEKFSGILVPFLKKMLDTTTLSGFIAMNEALKVRAERS